MMTVANAVRFNLGNPVVRIAAFGEALSPLSPVPSMPKVTIDKNHYLRPPKHNVGTPEKIARMQPIPRAKLKQRPAQSHLRTSVGGAIATLDSRRQRRCGSKSTKLRRLRTFHGRAGNPHQYFLQVWNTVQLPEGFL